MEEVIDIKTEPEPHEDEYAFIHNLEKNRVFSMVLENTNSDNLQTTIKEENEQIHIKEEDPLFLENISLNGFHYNLDEDIKDPTLITAAIYPTVTHQNQWQRASGDNVRTYPKTANRQDISRSARTRKKPSKLTYFETQDEIVTKFVETQDEIVTKFKRKKDQTTKYPHKRLKMSSMACLLPGCHGKGVFQKFKSKGIKTLIRCSKIRADGLHLELEELLEASGEDVSFNCHKSCYCSYTSKQNYSWKQLVEERKNCSIHCSKIRADGLHLGLEELLEEASVEVGSLNCHKSCYCRYYKKQLAGKGQSCSDDQLEKRKHCSDDQSDISVCRPKLPEFQFKLHCLFCGEVCLPKNPRNPGRWKRVIKCGSTFDGSTFVRPGLLTFKDVLLFTCDERKDEWGRQVEIRLKGALTDLGAVNAQYHKNCYDKFLYIPKKNNLFEQCKKTDNKDLNVVIDDV